jgi:hypothetical protein
MQHESPALGHTFSEWEQLTNEYADGMEALRRRVPGASARMMEIANLMSRYSELVGGPAGVPLIPIETGAGRGTRPRSASWFTRAVQGLPPFSGQPRRSSESLTY